MEWILNEEYTTTLHSESTGEAIQVFNEEGKLNIEMYKQKKDAGLSAARSSIIRHLGKIDKLDKMEMKKGEDDKSFMKRVFDNVKAKVMAVSKKIKSGEFAQELALSLMLLSMVIYVNSAVMIILNTMFGAAIGGPLTAIIVAPIVEEIGKVCSSALNVGKTYNTTFNIVEFSLYASRLAKFGIKTGKIVAVRMPAILMHTYNQHLIDKEKEGNDKLFKSRVTMAIHAIFNLIGTLFDSKIGKWLVK